MNINLNEMSVDLVINILNIIILFIIVKLLVYKPVKKFLDARNQRIAESLKKGEDAEKIAAELENNREELVNKGKAEAEEIIASAKAEAKANSAAVIEQAKAEAKEITEKAVKDAENERRLTVESARDDIAKLAVDISELILKREINEKDNEKIVSDYFQNGGKQL